MASDPSIYNQLGGANVVQPVNQLAAAGQGLQLQNQLLGVQQLQAQRAAGQAFQQSINPDGTTNQAQLMQNLAANPQAAMAAQQSAQAGQTLSNSEYAQHMQRLSYGASGAAQLLAQYPGGVPQTALKQYFDQAVQDGHLTPQDEAQSLSAYGPDPAQNSAIVKQRLLQNVSAQAALTGALPQSGLQDTGPGLQPTVTTTNLGGNLPTTLPVGAPIAKSLTPGQKADSATIGVTPGGGMVTGTKSQQLQMLGVGPDGNPISGRFIPPGLLNPNRPAGAPTAPGTTAAPASGGIVTSMGPVDVANRNAQIADNNTAFSKIADQAQQAAVQNAQLSNMLGDTKLFNSGQTDLNHIKGQLEKYAPGLASSMGVTPESVASQESFDKLASQIALSQGAGTDSRLTVASQANPSSHLSPAGADLMIRQLQGNTDYLQARAKLAATIDPTTTTRQAFESGPAANLDPRAFQFARLTAKQKITYDDNLSPTDRDKVRAAYGYAVKNHMITTGP